MVGIETGVGRSTPQTVPGVVAAWAVSFHRDTPDGLGPALLTVGSDTYDGTVTATLPDDLSGGAYEIVIEGLTDEDHAKIRLATGRTLDARLYLWWLDSPSGPLGRLANFTGLAGPLLAFAPKPPEHSLIAELRVDTLTRRAGVRRYETVVKARERVVARLERARVEGLCYDGLTNAVDAVAAEARITVRGHSLDLPAPPDTPTYSSVEPGRALNAVKTFGERLRAAQGLFGPSVVLIRDGELHLGRRPIPLDAARRLDEDCGLLAVERGPDADRDKEAGDPPPGAPRSRGTVTITALGRPDLKPGDTVTLALPPEDFPSVEPPSLGATLLTAVAGLVPRPPGLPGEGEPSTCVISTVNHKISRRAGFVTTVHAVVLADRRDTGWDEPGEQRKPAERKATKGQIPADVASAAARAIRALTVSARRIGALVGQVRRHASDGGTRHTSAVWYDDSLGDGRPARAQRTSFSEKHHGEQREVPYLTPIAWGGYGLVLPRYPGTRVLLDGSGDDLVDHGALWDRGQGPPAKAGDYWLVLPIGVADREEYGGDPARSGPATHDLLDADGTRIIETARFVIRVTDDATDCTERPKPGDAPAGSVLITTKSQKGSARILLADDGTVEISGKKIEFKAEEGIAMQAKKVDVKVADTMNIH